MTESPTFLDALVEALGRAGAYNKNDQCAPAAVLWTDHERQWEPILPFLRARLPLLTLGPYNPTERIGPAYWLRCMIDRTLDEDRLAPDELPIVYLPGISRAELRAVEECPRPLQPLAELQYRGVLWTHRNGRDWTAGAFVGSADGGLGVEVAGDAATREALQRSLRRLAGEPVAQLRAAAPLQASFFDGLLIADEVRSMLHWLDDPADFRATVDEAMWASFRELCRRTYGVDPERDGVLTAAERLGARHGAWEAVWQRFAEAPRLYPGLPDLLRRARPQTALPLFGSSDSWPQDNEAAEEQLRACLLALGDRPAPQARAEVEALEGVHAPRRRSVWAALGQAPLALALEPIARLARDTARPLSGTTAGEIAAAYAEWGWTVDAAVVAALAAVEERAHVAAIGAAVRSLYRPWLEAAATGLQRAVALGDPTQTYPMIPLHAPQNGTVVLFSDGLRFDAGRRLAAALAGRDRFCEVAWRLTPLPSITATDKPAVAPLSGQLRGGPKLEPAVTAGGTRVDVHVLRRLLREAGYQVLQSDEAGDPTGRAWTELGAIDKYGTEHGWKVARHLADEIRALEQRVDQLLAAGWQRVVVVTDHGWLLLPGGLPKVELPEHLTEVRKGRCARLKSGSVTDQQTVPWYWDHDVRIALAPGISCYEAGKEYEHGGLSPQECVTPVLTVTSGAAAATPITIDGIRWVGLRCRVMLADAPPGTVVDLRTRPADAASTLTRGPRIIGAGGQVSLAVEDDDRMGEAAVVVVLDGEGQVRAQAPTVVGGDGEE